MMTDVEDPLTNCCPYPSLVGSFELTTMVLLVVPTQVKLKI